jgi:hypothetical protein
MISTLKRRVQDAIAILQAEGLPVTARNVRDFARGGSFRDIIPLLRQWRAQGGVDMRPTSAMPAPVADFLRACCLLEPMQATSRLNLKHALDQWWDVSGTRIPWTTLKQVLHRRGCYGANGGHIWRGVGLHVIGPHMPRTNLPADEALPPCTVCKQVAWQSRYRDDVLECRRCRATALEVRAWVLPVQSRSATALELTLQHPGGVVTATGNPQQIRELSTLRSDQVVIAWGNLRRTGPSPSDAVLYIIALCDGGR